MYGAAAAVVVEDVEAGVGPVNEETPKSASITPCNLATPIKRANVLLLSYSRSYTLLPHTTTLSAGPRCVSEIPLSVGLAKEEETPETRGGSNPRARIKSTSSEEWFFIGGSPCFNFIVGVSS